MAEKLKFLHYTLNNCIILRPARGGGSLLLQLHCMCPEAWQDKPDGAQAAHRWRKGEF